MSKLGELIGFRRDLFFEGAVQLGWLEKAPERADAAATSYVFHGPAFHAVGQADHEAEFQRTPLMDTASFFRNLVAAATRPQQDARNPFQLAIAGYGTGKSHLGVTIARVLGGDSEASATAVLEHLEAVAPGHGQACRADLVAAGAPVLVVALDGMGDFNLGNELHRKIAARLRQRDLDLGPLDELSPRFERAGQFVRLNFELRRGAFAAAFGEDATAEVLVERLSMRDEACYLLVDALYREAVGSAIPAEGQESPEDLITTVCEHYCGPGKPFASLLILFDEFGRYLEFAADKPHVAGDAALQQMYQGVQTAHATMGGCRFLGLIQFDLKTYLALLEKRDARTLMRFLPRFDQAERTLLSSNLETLFANLIERRRPDAVRALLGEPPAERAWEHAHAVLARALPSFGRWQVWSDAESFRRVIVGGCWPLHPATVWFLSRLDNVVQSRSALSFVESALARVAEEPASSDGLPRCIYPADMVLGDMFGEILDAERRTHGAIAGEFAAIRERYAGKWEPEQERVLAAIVAAQKMRVKVGSQAEADEVLALLAGMPAERFTATLGAVIDGFGVAEWNADHKQYDLIIDAVSRGQFMLFLRKRTAEVSQEKVLDHFRLYGVQACALSEPEPAFAAQRRIDTNDWRYAVGCTTTAHLGIDVDRAVAGWRAAIEPQEPKGRLLYHLVEPREDAEAAIASFGKALAGALKAHGVKGPAPVIGLALVDETGEIARALAQLIVLERSLGAEDKARFQRFVEAEIEAARHRLQEHVDAAIRQRRYVLPEGAEIAPGRLDVMATKLFEAVYPAALSFVFDGYATQRGNAPKDCANLTKALAIGGIDANWAAQVSRDTANRARALLVGAWKTHSPDFRALRQPGYPALEQLLADLAERLVTAGSLDLHALVQELLAPPYGFNTASAGLVISVFLAAKQPLKGLADEKGSLAVDAWLQRIFQAKSHYDPARLKGTRIVHVEASVAQAWQQLFDGWVVEQRYRELVAYRARLRELARTAPMPAKYEDQAPIVDERAEDAKEKIAAFEDRVDGWYNVLQRFRNRDLSPILEKANQVLNLRREMQTDRARWSDEDLEMVEALLEACRVEVRANFTTWLADLRPTSVEGLGDFQLLIKRNATTIGRLGLEEEQRRLAQQGTNAAGRLQLHIQNQAKLDGARGLLDAARANHATPLALLVQWQRDLREQRDVLELVKCVEAEAGPLVAEMQRSEVQIANMIAEQRARLQRLAEREMMRFADLQDALEEADQAFAATDGTPERDFVQELRRQLRAAIEDWMPLVRFDGTRVELDRLVADRVAAREAEFSAADADPYWDFGELYAALAKEWQTNMLGMATRWLEAIVPEASDVEAWPLVRCGNALERLSTPPCHLPEEVSGRLADASHTLSARLAALEEVERASRAAAWLVSALPAESDFETLEAEACRQILERIETSPAFLAPSERDRVAAVRDRVSRRLDDLDFSQLLERARRLPPARLAELIALLASEAKVGR